jgi:hypothetical protein
MEILEEIKMMPLNEDRINESKNSLRKIRNLKHPYSHYIDQETKYGDY